MHRDTVLIYKLSVCWKAQIRKYLLHTSINIFLLNFKYGTESCLSVSDSTVSFSVPATLYRIFHLYQSGSWVRLDMEVEGMHIKSCHLCSITWSLLKVHCSNELYRTLEKYARLLPLTKKDSDCCTEWS